MSNITPIQQLPTENPELHDQLVVLMAVLHAMTCQMVSPDMVALSLMRAQGICDAAGIPQGIIDQTLASFAAYSKAMRSTNPLSSLF